MTIVKYILATVILSLSLVASAQTEQGAYRWKCNVCEEITVTSTKDLPPDFKWHEHTTSYTRIGHDGENEELITRLEWRNDNDPHTLAVVIFLVLLAIIVGFILHYNMLDEKYGDSLTNREKAIITTATIVGACVVGAKIGKKCSKKR